MRGKDEQLARNLNFYKQYSLFDYYRDYTASKTEIYQHLTSQWELQHMASLVISRPQIRRVLLIGLGFGREVDHLLKLHPDLHVSVLDFNEKFINAASAIYSSERVSFTCVDLNKCELPFKDGSFDLIIALNTLEYLDEFGYSSFFVEAPRVLVRDGALFFRLYNATFPFHFFDRRQLNKRSINQPMLYPRPFVPTLEVLERGFNIAEILPVSFQIRFRPFNFLYSNILAHVTWLLERLVCAVIPLKYARNVYFVGVKL